MAAKIIKISMNITNTNKKHEELGSPPLSTKNKSNSILKEILC